jgi:hypothetical protein
MNIDRRIVFGSLALASLGLAAYLLRTRTVDTLEVQDDKIEKISYVDFKKAASGDLELVAKVVKIFKEQKMVVITDIPKAKELRK